MKKEKGTPPPALIEGYRNALLFFQKGTIYFDEQGLVLNANEVAHQILGYAENTLPGKSVIDINPHLSLMGWRNRWASLLENNSHNERTEFLHAKGSLVIVNSLMALASEEGATHALLFFENTGPVK